MVGAVHETYPWPAVLKCVVALLFTAYVQPKTYLPGQHGDHRSLMLELKIIADVGLVGFPNVSAGPLSMLPHCVTARSSLYMAGTGREVEPAARAVERPAQGGQLPVHHAAPVCRRGGVFGRRL
jgi:hypothetical protein